MSMSRITELTVCHLGTDYNTAHMQYVTCAVDRTKIGDVFRQPVPSAIWYGAVCKYGIAYYEDGSLIPYVTTI
jgi:hypothetical protein